VEYEFIVERGPWWRGVWERLLQTVKSHTQTHWKSTFDMGSVGDSLGRSRECN